MYEAGHGETFASAEAHGSRWQDIVANRLTVQEVIRLTVSYSITGNGFRVEEIAMRPILSARASFGLANIVRWQLASFDVPCLAY